VSRPAGLVWHRDGMPPFVVLALGGSDCEALRSGWLAQPANAVSSLAYVAAGVWLLWRATRSGSARAMLVAAGAAMVGVGVGSVAYHGPQPDWARTLHDGSIVWLALVIIGHNLWLLTRTSLRRAVLSAAPALAAVPLVPGSGAGSRLPGPVVVAGVLVAGAVLARPTITAAARVAWRRSALWMAPALAAYVAGRTGSALCRPGLLWQPHAAWHVLSAAGLLCAVLGFAARTPRPTATGTGSGSGGPPNR